VIDHIYVSVTDVEKSLAFYAASLKPLGWRELGPYRSTTEGVPDLYGLCDIAYGSGTAIGSSIWLRKRLVGESGLYVGFVAEDTSAVDAAYEAAIKAGGKNEGQPSERTYFAVGYYAANVADFDDNRLEFVNKAFNPKSRS